MAEWVLPVMAGLAVGAALLIGPLLIIRNSRRRRIEARAIARLQGPPALSRVDWRAVKQAFDQDRWHLDGDWINLSRDFEAACEKAETAWRTVPDQPFYTPAVRDLHLQIDEAHREVRALRARLRHARRTCC